MLTPLPLELGVHRIGARGEVAHAEPRAHRRLVRGHGFGVGSGLRSGLGLGLGLAASGLGSGLGLGLG